MYQRRSALFPLASAIVAGFICGACATATSLGPEEEAEFSKGQVVTKRLAVLRGQEDRANQYTATVLINGGSSDGECSGVFISAQVVITAAHCVCKERNIPGESSQTVLDSTSCASSASVERFLYERKESGGKWLSTARFAGEVRPHAQFKILFDAQHNVVSHYADLAAIVLEKSVADSSYVKLPEQEIGKDTIVVVAGYGRNHVHGGTWGVRRFGTSTVKQVEPSKAGEVEAITKQGEAQVFEGDSGGPCLNKKGDTLVGIISSYGVVGNPDVFSDGDVVSICTSAYQHKAWLEQTIKQAGESHRATQ